MPQIDTNGALFQNGMLLGKVPIELSDQFPSAGDNPTSLTRWHGDRRDRRFQSVLDYRCVHEACRYWLSCSPRRMIGYLARCEVDGQCVTSAAFNAGRRVV